MQKRICAESGYWQSSVLLKCKKQSLSTPIINARTIIPGVIQKFEIDNYLLREKHVHV